MFDLQIRDGALKIHDAEDATPATVSPRSTKIDSHVIVSTHESNVYYL